ncbi:MAG: alpha-1,4-glucan--maltose-1-phosphate maltosyltransferase [Actinomycetota bacterium]|nr:alpha-1,4-glucan--maltose-1-phosphate maltosyltransferase [Actinomycetota bacterium]
MIGRIVIDDIRPRTPTRQYPAKCVVGEQVEVSADVFKDGHDLLAGRVLWRPCDKKTWSESRLAVDNAGLDRWHASITPTTLGRHEFVVEAWVDHYATWRHKAEAKLGAGQEIETELEEGARLVEARAKKADSPEDKAHLQMVARSLRDKAAAPRERLAPALTAQVRDRLDGPGTNKAVSKSETVALWVDRERALFGAWYEFFPRSEGGFQGARNRLTAVAEMGFDVVYFPPIHPIGRQYRKGPNNTLTASDEDPGSPWAIGGTEGGHTAIHPDLGTFTDFEDVVHKAHELGMEIALDYALQCSPDHPWVIEHPEWFHHRPDGTIAYAENPPKKYQDIYPINFWPDKEADRKALWDACKAILDFWIAKGVRIFRVDNPHTKPMAFWEWCIAAVQAEHAEVLFLAEAFTRPKVMAKLAEVGFTQSYTYFTWRTGADELREYVEELADSAKTDFMRPNFWPNTPDILAHPLRNGTPAAFKLRAVLAATLTPSYGIYSGFELSENEPMSDANEEYFHSEKYEVRTREWDDPRSIADCLTKLNTIRRRHSALQRLRNIRFHGSSNPQLLVFSKRSDDGTDVVLTIVNLDPWNAQEGTLDLRLDDLGVPDDLPYEAFDELSDRSFTWQGADPYVRLDPYAEVAHVLQLRSLS